MSPFGAKARWSGCQSNSCPLGAELHHRVAVLVANPDVVLGVNGHAVRLVLVADDLIADGADQLVILIEVEKLRFAGGVALEGEQVSFRVERDGRDATATSGQRERIRVCETQ